MKNSKNVLKVEDIDIRELITGYSKSNELEGLVKMKMDFLETFCGGQTSKALDDLETLAIHMELKALGGKSWLMLSTILNNDEAVQKIIHFLEKETEKGMIAVVDSRFEKISKVRFEKRTYLLIPAAI